MLLRGRGGTHGKLVLRVDGPPAHWPRVVEPLHVVGFIKAARQEDAEAPGSVALSAAATESDLTLSREDCSGLAASLL